MFSSHKPNLQTIKCVLDEISSETKTLAVDVKKDPDINGFSSPTLPEITISTYIPNDLYKAKRFYKVNPSWIPNDVGNTRCPSYFMHCASQVEIKDGLWAEFGVKFGKSMDILSDIKHAFFPNNKSRFCGFDSFEGFPENTQWGPQGHLSTDGYVPDIPGCKFYKGWFKDSIPLFNEHHDESLAFLHIDCDIYTSTVEILEGMKYKIVPGTVILFDDMLSYSKNLKLWTGEQHEFRAFMEFVKKYDVEYEWVAYVANSSQAACKIKQISV